MATSVRKRILDDLVRALGEDATQFQPDLDSAIVTLGYQVADLSFSTANRTSIKVWLHVIPTINVAQFSCMDFTPLRGMWVRVLAGFGGNMIVNLFNTPGQPAYAANDSLAGNSVVLSCPTESSDFPVPPVGLTGFALSDLIVGATPGAPNLFQQVQIGRLAAARTGAFLPANVASNFVDLWVPPLWTLEVSSGTANQAISVQMQLEFPAETLFLPG